MGEKFPKTVAIISNFVGAAIRFEHSMNSRKFLPRDRIPKIGVGKKECSSDLFQTLTSRYVRTNQ